MTADNVLITGVQKSKDPFGADFTGLITITGIGGKNGGNLRVRANSVVVTTKGTIASGSLGAGDSGIIEINAGNLHVLDAGTIFSSAMGAGQGGDIIINADRVVVSGVNSEPFIDTSQPANQLSLAVSGISSQVGVKGASSQVGGKVRITTGSLELLD